MQSQVVTVRLKQSLRIQAVEMCLKKRPRMRIRMQAMQMRHRLLPRLAESYSGVLQYTMQCRMVPSERMILCKMSICSFCQSNKVKSDVSRYHKGIIFFPSVNSDNPTVTGASCDR